MNWYLRALSLSTDFNGRATREEYWMFVLFNVVFAIVALILDNIMNLTLRGTPYGIIYILYNVGMIMPALAIAVRRLHDVGKSGWMMLIGLIPIIGGIWLIVLFVQESVPEEGDGTDTSSVNTTEQNSGDTLILFAIVWMCLSRLFWAVVTKFVPEYYSTGWFKIISSLMNLVWAFLPLMLAFTIKDKSKQRILFVLAGLYLLYSLFDLLLPLIRF